MTTQQLFTRNVVIGLIVMLFTVMGTGLVSAAERAGESAAIIAAERPAVEVVFVLDTTGSMGGLIAAAKDKIWSIANTLATADPAPQIRMGLVGYRDRGDAYVTLATPLSDDLDAVYTQLMQFQADGGGDGPESVNQALYEAVTRPDWSRDLPCHIFGGRRPAPHGLPGRCALRRKLPVGHRAGHYHQHHPVRRRGRDDADMAADRRAC